MRIITKKIGIRIIQWFFVGVLCSSRGLYILISKKKKDMDFSELYEKIESINLKGRGVLCIRI